VCAGLLWPKIPIWYRAGDETGQNRTLNYLSSWSQVDVRDSNFSSSVLSFLSFSSESLGEEKGIRKKISFFNILGEYFE
jgi:hypothetical protein